MSKRLCKFAQNGTENTLCGLGEWIAMLHCRKTLYGPVNMLNGQVSVFWVFVRKEDVYRGNEDDGVECSEEEHKTRAR